MSAFVAQAPAASGRSATLSWRTSICSRPRATGQRRGQRGGPSSRITDAQRLFEPARRLIWSGSELVCTASSSKPPALNPAETLTGDEAESFKQSVEAVAAASGVDESAAAAAVARAFGWSNQSYWCGEKENEAPPAGQVAGVLSLLSELGFDADGVKFLVEKFPEVLGLDIEKRLKRALVKLEYDYGISGSTLIGVVKREPRVLGYNLDCGGDCAGECHRCWVRF